MPQLIGLHVYPLKSAYRLSPESATVEPWGLTGDRRWMLVDATGRAVTQREEPALGQLRVHSAPDGSLTLTAPDGATLRVEAPSAAAGAPLAEVEIFGALFKTALAPAETGAWFGERFGERFARRVGAVRLVHLDDPAAARAVHPDFAHGHETVSLADGFPLQIASTASLAALNEHLAADHPDDPRKSAALPMERFRPNLVIDGLEPWAEDGWRRVRVGEVTFRVAKPCGRCVITTTDQETGARRGPEPLRALGRHHRFGKSLAFGVQVVPERPEGRTGDQLGTVRLGDAFTVLEEGPRLVPDGPEED
ncbi:molybdenum cofactor biosysynthesis protein [Kitasatospora sp. MMS16-BH015]|uniref:MOSC domain-containing protein n=1 Tax=Kitasatospora sp. MMS16-BH015 TaxID=2018025 RepID=UPI000CA3D838|nr:MOSC N-terminal beta barrel domain-containing protein [Kitasatospora sp. MMS16-BH015]AUG81342.1 molybdenum cofactor biosysynthesis protein [Kitasatospora sp. MMS16-BH015]